MDLLARLLIVSNPEVRAAAVYALGTLIQASTPNLQDSLAVMTLRPSLHSDRLFSNRHLIMQGPAEEAEALSQANEAEHHGPEGETLAVDRAIACHLLQIVYDASPLVRAEVALSLSRLVSGHNVLFQVYVGFLHRQQLMCFLH